MEGHRGLELALPVSTPLPPPNGNYSGSANDGEPPAAAAPTATTNHQQARRGRVPDPKMDPKKLKRILASRKYSEKYRLKQLNYISSLESEMKIFQTELSLNSPRADYVNRHNALLRIENDSMKEKLSFFLGELVFKEAQYKELRKERDFMNQFFTACMKQYPELVIQANPETYSHIRMSLSRPESRLQMPSQDLNLFQPGRRALSSINFFNQRSKSNNLFTI